MNKPTYKHDKVQPDNGRTHCSSAGAAYSPEAIPASVELQRRLGNSAMRRFLQAKLSVNHPGDAHKLAHAVNARPFSVGCDVASGAAHCAPETERAKHSLAHELKHAGQQGFLLSPASRFSVTPSPLALQRGPPQTEAGRFALGIAAEDQRYLRTVVVSALRASGEPVHVNTADAIDHNVLSLDVLTRHPEPDQHTTERPLLGTYFFPGTDLNTVIESSIYTGGGANVPGAPANRIYIVVRRHFNDPPPHNPTVFFRRIVHEAQHYFDHHVEELRARGTTDREVFDLWLGYKTEFNAYWADGSYDYYPVTPAGRPRDDPRRPLRWEAIRDFLMTTPPYGARFRWLWADSPPPSPSNDLTSQWRTRMYPLYHTWFSERIDNYCEPEAFNRLNSPRIEQFFSALSARSINPAQVRSAVNALGDSDRAELRASTRFQDLINQQLRGRPGLRNEVLQSLRTTATPP